MRRRTALLTMVVTLALGTGAPVAARSGSSDEPVGVRALLEEYERAWNEHEAAAVAAFFTREGDLLMGNGPRVRGREAVERWWAGYFSHLDPGRRGAFSIDSIRSIAPDVGLVDVDTRTGGRDADGQELPTRLARGTWVVVRQDGEWRIAAMRGHPAEGEARVAAGRDR